MRNFKLVFLKKSRFSKFVNHTSWTQKYFTSYIGLTENPLINFVTWVNGISYSPCPFCQFFNLILGANLVKSVIPTTLCFFLNQQLWSIEKNATYFLYSSSVSGMYFWYPTKKTYYLHGTWSKLELDQES